MMHILSLILAVLTLVSVDTPAKADSSGARVGPWKVRAYSKETGEELGSADAGPGSGPRFDGMAAADGRLFASTKDGNLVCLR